MKFVNESAKFTCLFAVAGLLMLAGCTKVAAPEQGAAADSTLKQVLQRVAIGRGLDAERDGFSGDGEQG